MRLKIFIGILLSVICITNKSYSQTIGEKVTYDYFGLNPPANEPVVFAKGIISTKHHENSSPTFSPDGKEILWSYWLSADVIKILRQSIINK